MKKYDWGIIGGGITGLVLAEILTREGFSVILIEKNSKLAGETTRDFHEWIHTGSLYTLLPDNLKTLAYILGAIDDLLEYYSSFRRMNLISTFAGLKIDNHDPGWFLENFIHFKYRIKNRKFTFPWLIGIARSVILIEKIKNHDWLRRRAGEKDPFKKNRLSKIIRLSTKLIESRQKFYTIETPDFTTDSRLVLRDLLETALHNGLDLLLENVVESITDQNNGKLIHGTKEDVLVDRVAICAGGGIADFSDVKISKTYAPIAVVSGTDNDTKSFVELDYYPKNCINLISKPNGMGLAGGISFKNIERCNSYLDYVMSEHIKRNPKIIEVYRYIGIKSEITFKKEPRSYLYHIVETKKNVWAVVPGKFTLCFSLAPEFFRRIYNRNPKKNFETFEATIQNQEYIADTVWYENQKYN